MNKTFTNGYTVINAKEIASVIDSLASTCTVIDEDVTNRYSKIVAKGPAEFNRLEFFQLSEQLRAERKELIDSIKSELGYGEDDTFYGQDVIEDIYKHKIDLCIQAIKD